MSEYVYEVTDVAASPGLTPSQTVGPFFHDALPYPHGASVAGAGRDGAVRLTGRVLDGQGSPLPDSLVEIWQADEQGRFVEESGIYDEPAAGGFRGFGRCATDADGCYEFRTVKPGAVPTRDGTAQAPHIAMSVFARGMLRRVATRVYFPDEAAANRADPLLTTVPEDRRATLVASAVDGGYRFDVRIQGDDETVFLDVFER
jgi:protocatechuate 3,4-dioxygenase alpha subunit